MSFEKIIQIDDIVKLSKEAKDYGKWANYTFRVIDTRFANDAKNVRIVRNFRNEKMGSTNCYIIESSDNLVITKKNKKAQEQRDVINLMQDIDF